jgi:signal transduction histidine kinase
VTALVGGPQFTDTRLVEPGNAAIGRYRARMALVAADRATPAADDETGGNRFVQRAAVDTRLPWSVRVVDTDPGAELAAAAGRRRVVLAGLAALGLFVLGGGAFIVRAVNRELEVSRLQTDFVAAVSHEFRTPLTSMRQVSELLLEGRVPEGRREDYYRMQHRDSARLQRLVESLLDFARMERGRRPYDLRKLDACGFVEKIVGEFRRDAEPKGFSVDLEMPSAGLPITADGEALGHALWNLLDNAVKYSGDSRTVRVRVEGRSQGVAITVLDEGFGIPASERTAIFHKFVRGEQARRLGIQGTGIGLAMAGHIVAAHRGKIELESAVGRGSAFTILLPRGD